MNNFTKGEWHVTLSDNATPRIFVYDEFNDEAPVCDFPAEIMRSYNSLANAKLIATAGNTANALASQGIDAIKAIDMLPNLIDKDLEDPLVNFISLIDKGLEVKRLKNGLELAKELLEVAVCPQCDGSGAYYSGDPQGPDVNQCQFCYERDRYFAELKGEQE